jgi:pyrroline-5-carboxylate reductase
VSLIRAMPNTPALVGEGITGVLASGESRALADSLFGAVGEVVHLTDEAQFDAVTAVSGSGPAFVFVAIEALADGGVAMGLPREMATQLAIQTVLGAATLARTEKVHVAELKDRVASPGGTTIAGLAALENAGFRAALIEAVRAATLRGRELGKG